MQFITTTPVRLVRFLRPVPRNELRRILEESIGHPVHYRNNGGFWTGDCFVAVRQDQYFMWVREPFVPHIAHEALEVKFATDMVTAIRCG